MIFSDQFLCPFCVHLSPLWGRLVQKNKKYFFQTAKKTAGKPVIIGKIKLKPGSRGHE
jgi:hypothetical protein